MGLYAVKKIKKKISGSQTIKVKREEPQEVVINAQGHRVRVAKVGSGVWRGV